MFLSALTWSEEDTYVSQDILLAALQQGEEFLETDLNSTVVDIDVPTIVGEATPPTTTPSGDSAPDYLVAVIVAAGVLFTVSCFFVFMVFLCSTVMYATL